MSRRLRQSAKNQSSRGWNNRIRILFLIALVLAAVKGYLWYSQLPINESATLSDSLPENLEEGVKIDIPAPAPVSQQEEKKEPVRKSFPPAPFYIQAPLGQWSDYIFQSACEEATMLMAADAVAGKTRTAEETSKELQKIANWQKTTFGTSVDTNAEDVARTLREYFLLTNVQREENLTVKKIQAILEDKAVLLVPLNGQKLRNPHFTPPGPKTHMALITGYNQEKDTFITQDPGTKFGKNYEYKSNVLEAALGDYPTGNHLSYDEPLPKTGVSVWVEE